jgi:hypothetical protein
MKRIAMLASVAALLSGPAIAADDHVGMIAVYVPNRSTCGQLLSLEAVSAKTSNGNGTISLTPAESNQYQWYIEATGWLKGYLTAMNYESDRHNGSANLFEGVDIYKDVWPWVLSWCRSNPTRNIHAAAYAFVKTTAGDLP